MTVNPNSMTIWFPVVERLQLPHPRTIMVPLGDADLEAIWNETAPPDESAQRWLWAAREIGFPLFLRNDLTSGKHSWRDTCYVPDERDLLFHVYQVVQDAEMHWAHPVTALAFREYVPLESTFEAFAGMPVARERRYFAIDGTVKCHHPYWPAGAMLFYGEHPADWKARLGALNEETDEEVAELTVMAETVTREIAQAWSVDFAHARDGRWLLIDMARAGDSWHPEDCPEKAP